MRPWTLEVSQPMRQQYNKVLPHLDAPANESQYTPAAAPSSQEALPGGRLLGARNFTVLPLHLGPSHTQEGHRDHPHPKSHHSPQRQPQPPALAPPAAASAARNQA
jgi:hypothetical protein